MNWDIIVGVIFSIFMIYAVIIGEGYSKEQERICMVAALEKNLSVAEIKLLCK